MTPGSGARTEGFRTADICRSRLEANPYRWDVRIFRATVRGQFDGLDEDQADALRARADEHDILNASFTKEGSFVYSPGLTWFNLRYEVRHPDETSDREVETASLEQAAERLDRMGIPFKRLRVDLMDMASVWQD